MADSTLTNIGDINRELAKTNTELGQIQKQVDLLSQGADDKLRRAYESANKFETLFDKMHNSFETMRKVGLRNTPFDSIIGNQKKVELAMRSFSDSFKIAIDAAKNASANIIADVNSIGGNSIKMGDTYRDAMLKMQRETTKLEQGISKMPEKMISAMATITKTLGEVGNAKLGREYYEWINLKKVRDDAQQFEAIAKKTLDSVRENKEKFASEDDYDKKAIQALHEHVKAFNQLYDAQEKFLNSSKRINDIKVYFENQITAVNDVQKQYQSLLYTIKRLSRSYSELYVKKRAGIVDEETFKAESKKLISAYNEAIAKKKEFQNVDISRASREQAKIEADAVYKLRELYRQLRQDKERVNDLSAKKTTIGLTKEEIALRESLNNRIRQTSSEIVSLSREFRGIAEFEKQRQKEYIANQELSIKLRQQFNRLTAPSVTLGSTTGDLTNKSAAYRTQIKLLQELIALREKENKINRDLRIRRKTKEDDLAIQEIKRQRKKIREDMKLIDEAFSGSRKKAVIDNRNQSIQRLRDEVNKATMATAEWSLVNAKSARTLDQLNFAANNLRKVMAKTDPKSESWRRMNNELSKIDKRINSINDKMKGFHISISKLFGPVSQLASAFGIMFSVQQIGNFMREIANVTGELEMAYRSMQAIIQDKLKADQIYQETLTNAVNSPFRIQQLITYTKQLAAYRVESEKLVDTTKRLADISAGLGVDMNRIILAFGQVKAANYLRASEVRQFTEAGINMYGELAKYFSELEGVEVTTADVIERVTKRMVTFEDVEEIFKRMTDAGGTFYNMQEIQSETLKGMLDKLYDSYTLFLNKIGTNKGGLLNKWFGVEDNLDFMKSLIDSIILAMNNLDTFSRLLRITVPLIILYATRMKTAALSHKLFAKSMVHGIFVWKKFIFNIKTGVKAMFTLRQSTVATGSAFKAFFHSLSRGFKRLSLLIKANPVGFILNTFITAFIFFDEKLRLANEKADTLNEKLSQMRADVQNNAIEYKRLANVVKDTSASYEEQEEALKSLKRQFGEMLPTYMLERKYIAENTNGYRDATAIIKEYTAAKAKEAYIQDVVNETERELIDVQTKLAKRLVRGTEIQKANLKPLLNDFREYVENQKEIDFSDWVNKTSSEQAKAINQLTKEFKNLLYERFGKDTSNAIWLNIDNMFKRYVKAIINGKMQVDDALYSTEFSAPIADAYSEEDEIVEKKLNDRIRFLREKQDELIKERKKYTKFVRGENIYAKEYDKISKELVAVNNELQKMQGMFFVNADSYRRMQSYYEKDVTNVLNAIESETRAFKNLRISKDAAIDSGRRWSEAEEKALQEHAQKLTEFATKFRVDPNNKLLDPENAIGSIAGWETYIREWRKVINKAFIDTAPNGIAFGSSSLFERAKKEMGDVKDWKDELIDFHNEFLKENRFENKLAQNYIELSNTGLKPLTDLNIKDFKSAQDYGKKLREVAGDMELFAKQAERAQKAGKRPEASNLWKTYENRYRDVNDYLSRYKEEVEAILDTADIFDPKDEKKKNGRIVDVWSQRFEILKKMRESFKESAKEMSADKSMRVVKEDYQDAFNQVFSGLNLDYSKLDISSDEALAKWMENDLRKAAGILKSKDLKKFLTFVADMKIEFQIEQNVREKFERSMDEMFNNYEVSINLSKLNIPKEEATKIFGIDFTSVQEMRDAVEAWRKEEEQKNTLNGKKGFGEEDLALYRKYNEKIDEIEEKAQKERLDKYVKNLEESLSERAKLEMNYVKSISEVEAESAFTPLQKSDIKKSLDKKYKEAQHELAWKEFKDSNYYIEMMEDLESKSFVSLGILKNKLIEIKDSAKDIPTDAMKEIVNSIEKITKLEAVKKPLKSLNKGLKEVMFDGELNARVVDEQIGKTERFISVKNDEIQQLVRMLKLREEESNLNKKFIEQTKNLKDNNVYTLSFDSLHNAQDMLNQYQQQSIDLDARKDSMDEKAYSSEKYRLDSNITLYRELIQTMSKLLNVKQLISDDDNKDKSIDNLNGEIDALSTLINLGKDRLVELYGKQKAYKLIGEAVKSLSESLTSLNNNAKQAFDAIFDNLDYLGYQTTNLSSAWKDFGDLLFDSISKGIQMINQFTQVCVNGGAAINVAFGVIGLIATAIQLFIQLSVSVAKIHDSRLQDDIEAYRKKVDNLTHAYERLETKIKETYSYYDYVDNYNLALENTTKRINELKKARAAEVAKKKSDEDVINGFDDEIVQLTDDIANLKNEIIDTFGGIGEENYRTAANDFVSAWKQSFLETGNGLEGLKEHFNEYLLNWFDKQATMKIAGSILKPLFQMVDDAVSLDGENGALLTANELDKIRERAAELFPQLSDSLEDLFNALGLSENVTGNLSGLTKGIQSITEAQAEVIEQYMNSIRMFVADNNTRLTQIENSLLNENSNSPILSQLKHIAYTTTAIRDLLSSVTTSSHPMGGSGIKVIVG